MGDQEKDRAALTRIIRPLRVTPGRKVSLPGDFDPRDTGGLAEAEAPGSHLPRGLELLAEYQDRLAAQSTHGVLLVLQALDAAGKDGTVKHVMSGVNPSGCEVVAFKVPNDEEAAHDYLWRVHRATPRRGHITIFNRSHYEDVIVPRVHRTLPRSVLRRRYHQINAFERTLAENDTLVLKFFLHISKAEQRRRLRERIDDPTKRWKFSEGDVKERALWDDYMAAYEKLLTRCSTRHAPWYVVPSDHKWYRNLVVASVLVDAIKGLHPTYPEPSLSLARMHRLRF
jgi:PPK2 family polyphosphate:nucleotide phosphotransferase